MRYAEAREDAGAARKHAEETLADIRSFIRRSARKEMITRSFMKYGPRRIASLFAVVVMLVLSGFYGYNADQKKNNRKFIEEPRSGPSGKSYLPARR